MNYKEIEKTIDKYIDIKDNDIPINAFNIAQELNIRVKNSIEAKQDFANTINPLNYSNGFLSISKGEYVIYHDEKNVYKNFTVAHETAHYMLHHGKDGAEQHEEANLMAAALIAPKRLILRSKIGSPRELSEKCQIPIEVAQSYWVILGIKKRSKNLLSLVAACCVVATTGMSAFYFSQASTPENANTPSPAPTVVATKAPAPSYEPIETDSVYITPSGKKYHKSGCVYVRNKVNILEIPTPKAQELGYDACKVCF